MILLPVLAKFFLKLSYKHFKKMYNTRHVFFFFVLKLFGVPSMSVISVLVIKHMPEMSSVFCMEMCLRFVIMAVMFRADSRDEL